MKTVTHFIPDLDTIKSLRNRCKLYLALAVVFFLGFILMAGAWISLVHSLGGQF